MYLASALIKFIWSSSTGTNPLHGTAHANHLHGHGHVHGLLSTEGVVGSAAGILGLGGLTDLSKVPMPGLDCRVVASPFSSCDNSASMEPSNSDDDQVSDLRHISDMKNFRHYSFLLILLSLN